MTHLLTPAAGSHELTAYDLDPGDVVTGSPRVASAELGQLAGVEIGLWEMTEGVATDTEVDEVFVVLAGEGEVVFADGERIELRPGVIVRLNAGERTTWTIRSPLRKVYIAVG